MNPANATVTDIRRAGERHAVVQIVRDSGPLHQLPGQYIEIGSTGPEGDWQQPYSIASAPGAPHVELFAQTTGPAQHVFVQGTRLWVAEQAHGLLVCEGVPKERGLLLIGTGSGVAPFISMVRSVVPAKRFRHVWLVHGAFAASELAYDAEMKTLAVSERAFSWVPVLERGGSPLRVVQEVVDAARFASLAGEPLSPVTINVFLCGHPAMLTDLSSKLTALGFGAEGGAGRVHTERSG